MKLNNQKGSSDALATFLAVIIVIVFYVVVWGFAALKRTGKGSSVVTLVDVSTSGLIFRSCEIDVQYGKESSKIESYSTTDLSMCGELEKLTGEKIKLKYHEVGFSIRTSTNDILDGYELVKQWVLNLSHWKRLKAQVLTV